MSYSASNRKSRSFQDLKNCLLLQYTYLKKSFFRQSYNTRLFKKANKFKQLYIDLSTSKILITPSKQVKTETEDSFLETSTSTFCRRNSTTSLDSAQFDFSNFDRKSISTPTFSRRVSTTSLDSTEFGFSNYSSRPYIKNFEMSAPPINVCPSVRSPQNNWLKCIYGFCLMGSLYIIILCIHNGAQLRKISKEVENLKHDLNDNIDTETRMYRMETCLNNMKRDHESLLRNVRSLVNAELEKFSADKTGKTDFALEASGGKIVRLSSDTQNFNYAKTVFGITLCEGMHGPRAMLQPDMSPGHCWAIKGSSGGAVIKLIGKVLINEVTLEHISENMSPSSEITSAPKDFEIWGLKDPMGKGVYLGRFRYELNGKQVHTFEVTNSNYYEYVEFKVLTNHNNPNFTCVYRFRVHGALKKEEEE